MATKTKIGKDVIESLTMGMYEDSRFIYREYIQNSADQIDIGVAKGILESSDDGFIDIDINQKQRIITIKDNATGIELSKAEELLKNIAKSSKDRTKNKGFRGIGRLGGLGYCEKLVFETTYKGEDKKTILTWDSNKLRSIINDRSKQQEASEVIDDVTTVAIQNENADDHFFTVKLIDVSNDMLLHKGEIIEYLSMVAPVPFDKGFVYSQLILDFANSKSHPIDSYKVYVNSDQVYKSYTSTIYSGEGNNKKRFSEVIEIQTFELSPKIWGWYSISQNLTKQIPANSNLARGIRLRKGNIQIGSDASLSRFFTEDRFNYYFFGEVHVMDENLIPNARRDYFIENKSLVDFEKKLRALFSGDLSKLVRYASSIKSSATPIKKLEEFTKEFQEKSSKGFSGKEEKARYEEELEELKERATKAEINLKKESEKVDKQSSKGKIFDHITSEVKGTVEKIIPVTTNNTIFITDSLSKLDRKQKKLLSKVFTIIDQVLPKEIAENLKEKVKEEFR